MFVLHCSSQTAYAETLKSPNGVVIVEICLQAPQVFGDRHAQDPALRIHGSVKDCRGVLYVVEWE